MYSTIIRYVWSTAVTFFAGFALVVVPALGDDFTLEAIRSGAYVGIVFSGVRFGVKMVLELFLVWYTTKFTKKG